MSAKGYVVRGKDEDGDWVSTDAGAANEAAANYWISCADWQLSDVAIFAVAEDGTETPLPSYEEALAALSQTQDLLSKAGDDVLRMSAEIERMRGAAKDMAFALAPWKYEGSIEGPGANDVVMKHRALCWVLFGEGAPPITEEERDAWQTRRTERQKARTA